MNLAFWLSLVGILPAGAVDGEKQYQMLCGACHGPEGQGSGEGQFPPLAGSEWVRGDAERMVQIILHGLEGPVSVAGKNYNLAMPPQGAALNDDQIAAITNFIRSSWGNTGKTISAGQVAEMRKNTAEQKGMWKQNELLKRWPLQGPLENLVAYTYQGAFQKLPDFSKLEPKAVEEEASGFVDVAQSGIQDRFGMVWEADLRVPSAGEYQFRLDSDDGSQLFVNGQKVVQVKGIGPLGRLSSGKVKLEAGLAKFRLEYFENQGGQGVTLSWKGPNLPEEFLSKSRSHAGQVQSVSIPIVVEEETRIYRNFIQGASPRAIGVGYPGGINIAFSADDLGLSLAWLGKFMDAGRHWTGRGKGFQPPAGHRIFSTGKGEAFGILESGQSFKPAKQAGLWTSFLGYNMDFKRRPKFRYLVDKVAFTDHLKGHGGRELHRTLLMNTQPGVRQNLAIRLAGPQVKELSPLHYETKGRIQIIVAKSDVATPIVTEEGLFLQLNLSKGQARVGMKYVWK